MTTGAGHDPASGTADPENQTLPPITVATTPAIARYGERAVLIDVAPGTAAGVAAHLRATLGARALDIVPTSHCVLVGFAEVVDLDDVARALTARPSSSATPPAGEPVVIPVDYRGEDLDEVARASDMSPEAVVAVHSGADYQVEFFGFAPGFAYLSGLPRALHLPRRPEPRTSVPAGSVAIAAGYAAVYPRSSPGGWHLLGHTELTLFDASRADRPSLLQPGDVVRFAPR